MATPASFKVAGNLFMTMPIDEYPCHFMDEPKSP
jgi:hypothetical protein